MLALLLLWKTPIFPSNSTFPRLCYNLSLHDALPILQDVCKRGAWVADVEAQMVGDRHVLDGVVEALADRKSTRLNSSHANNSYAVFCLKKKRLLLALLLLWKTPIFPSNSRLPRLCAK